MTEPAPAGHVATACEPHHRPFANPSIETLIAFRLAAQLSDGDPVQLELDWGDHLCQLKQVDMAVAHYIEAGQSTKAIEHMHDCGICHNDLKPSTVKPLNLLKHLLPLWERQRFFQ